MNPFRSIIATLLALLIASPLCCCIAKGDDAPVRHSCCEAKARQDGKKSPDKDDHTCACKTKEPRDQAKNLELPHSDAPPLEPHVFGVSSLSPRLAVDMPMASTPHTGCDPPRLLLARYARWLI